VIVSGERAISRVAPGARDGRVGYGDPRCLSKGRALDESSLAEEARRLMSHRTWQTGAVVVTLLSVATALRADGIDLTPQFELGSETLYVTASTIEHEIQLDTNDPPQKIIVRMETGMSFEATQLHQDKSVTLAWTLQYVTIESDGMIPGIDDHLAYDSRNTTQATSPLAPLFADMVGKPLIIRVDSSGKVLDVARSPGGGFINPVGHLPIDFLSRSAFEQLPLLTTVGAPTPARQGARWSKEATAEMPFGAGAIVLLEDFTVKRIDSTRGIATIGMRGKLGRASTHGSAAAGALFDVANGTASGSFVWDFRARRLVSAETSLNMETQLNSPLGPMRMTQKVSSAVTRVVPEQRR